MNFKRNLKNTSFILFFGICLILIGLLIRPQITLISPITLISARVTKVIDGDSIEIEGSRQVRLIGIDAPEYNNCFGKESRVYLSNLLVGKEVQLEKDISEVDKYGRSLRYVHIGGVLVNDELVRQGYAQVATYPPDVKYQNQFLGSEKHAKENGLGLWSSCYQFPKSPQLL